MSELYIPVSHGRYPEDGEKIADLAFEDEVEAMLLGEKMTDGEYGHNEFYVKELEIVRE